MFEAVGAHDTVGKIDEDGTIAHLEGMSPAPAAVRAAGMFTANSYELHVRGHRHGAAQATAPSRRYTPRGTRLAKAAGDAGDGASETAATSVALDIMTPQAMRNALSVDMALGCSTNTVLHLAAIAHEAGIPYDLKMINDLSEKVPNLCKLAPSGQHHMQDLDRAGGVHAVMHTNSLGMRIPGRLAHDRNGQNAWPIT